MQTFPNTPSGRIENNALKEELLHWKKAPCQHLCQAADSETPEFLVSMSPEFQILLKGIA